MVGDKIIIKIRVNLKLRARIYSNVGAKNIKIIKYILVKIIRYSKTL